MKKHLRLKPGLLLVAALLVTETLFAADPLQQIPLWPSGAPGFESRKDIPEQARDYWVRNINNPSLTVFLPPKDKANGAAVLICPGGGQRELVFNEEGVKPAKFLNNLGVAAFVLKYRLARETNSPYSLPKHPTEDVQRAMRLIRSRAAEWNLDTNRIGVMGFSAGGEVAAWLVYHSSAGLAKSADPVDRVNCRADFQIVIYPGPLGVPRVVPTNAPPAFFLAANDDHSAAAVITDLLAKFRQAGVPAEVHLYAQGSHAFNMGDRSKLASIHDWPQRLADWLADSGYLKPAATPAK
jgi:acetyl esterase/lipase